MIRGVIGGAAKRGDSLNVRRSELAGRVEVHRFVHGAGKGKGDELVACLPAFNWQQTMSSPVGRIVDDVVDVRCLLNVKHIY